MSFWRNIARRAVCNVDEAECTDCPPGLPGQDPAFSTAVTALGAKLAKADGEAHAGEYEAFAQVFQPEPGSRGAVRRLYQLARQTTRGFESYARRLAKRYRTCPHVLEDVLDGLFFVATSDGVVTADEMAYLRRVSELFGQSPLVFRRIRAMHLGLEADDPYAVLDVAHDAPDADVRSAWKRMLSESHPDRVRSRGLPDDFVVIAEAKAASINAAFDAVMRERRTLSPQDAA